MNDDSTLGDAVAVLALAVAGYAVEGWVLWKVWDWWFLDLGAPALPYGTAVVIVFVVGMLTYTVASALASTRVIVRAYLSMLVVAPLTLWILGIVA